MRILNYRKEYKLINCDMRYFSEICVLEIKKIPKRMKSSMKL